MLRHIKFRAWDGIEMWPNVIPNKGEILAAQPFTGETKFLKMVSIMQFTGLKDRNGKEIYEGDIVLHPAYPDPFIIKFITCSFGACEMGENFILDTIAPQICEIIGNIHENPELLEDRKP